MTKKVSFKILMFSLFYFVLMIWMINIGIYKDLILLSFMILYYFTSVRQLIAEYKTKMIDPANKIVIHKANMVNLRNNRFLSAYYELQKTLLSIIKISHLN
ncbi:hypothetical protein BHX94_06000 [Macrococcoides bohemicum]|uniref:Uncharacterized protein n=1 Tax=Macrococcoides bohemicum TaxID=1903056 RepID=A0A328A4B3_9STAP|nr:hypothetical protein BHX94_06000 [Macrococcus bohemicus]